MGTRRSPSPPAARLPPLHALAAFEAAARRLSFLEAAAELAITPSAVSRRIQLLESRLGTRLFMRTHRAVRLTEEGERYLARVRTVLGLLQEAGGELGAPARRVIRLQAAPGIAATWLAQEIVRYQEVDGAVEFVLSGGYSLAALRTGAIDCAIRYGEDDWGRLTRRALGTESLFPVASPSYRPRSGRLESPADLLDASLLRHPLLSWRRWFAGVGIDAAEPVRGAQFDDALVMLEAAAQGAGVALIVSSVFERARVRAQLVALFEPVPDQAYFIVLSEAGAERRWVREFSAWLVRRAGGAARFEPL